jgi:hypothetical protein
LPTTQARSTRPDGTPCRGDGKEAMSLTAISVFDIARSPRPFWIAVV